VRCALVLQTISRRAEALLVIFKDVNSKLFDEISVGSQKAFEAAVLDLQTNLARGLFRHAIAEAIESVFQQGLHGGLAFVAVKSCFDMEEGNAELVAQVWNGDDLRVMRCKVFGNSENDGVTIELAEWMQ
jgi:hypothetical protein